MEKSLSSPLHSYWKFGTGNFQTLGSGPESKGLDVRSELLKFHKNYYSANLMKLVVLGKGGFYFFALISHMLYNVEHNRNTG